VVDDRCIKNVIHFTRLSNLQSILLHGLLSRFDLLQANISKNSTMSDVDRLDENDHAISGSVSCFYPYMFDAKRHRSGNAPWVILALNPSLLWELNCHFYAHSVLSRDTKYERGIGRRNSGYAFESLFHDHRISVDGGKPWYRETAGLPPSFPTHPDSEVQVFDPIHPKYLQGAWVETTQDEAEVLRVLETFGINDFEVWVEPFKPRHKYQQIEWG
jgi:hypothetical protein